jgi:putative CocE/NonD family hydrolase
MTKHLRTTLAILPALLTGAQAQTTVLKAKLAGAEIGTLTAQRSPDGSFQSKTILTIAGTKIETELKGKLQNGRITHYLLTQTAAGRHVTVELNDNKVTIELDGKKSTFDSAPKGTAHWANYHPITAASLLPLAKSPTPLETPIFMLDGGRTANFKISLTNTRTLHSPSGTTTVKYILFDLGSVQVTYAVSEDGRVLGMHVPAQQFTAAADEWPNLFADPLDKYPELSRPTFETTLTTTTIPMRDGTKLTAEILRPKTQEKVPAILIRTPYGRKAQAALGGFWASRGYALIVQDCRGRGDSEGEWEPFLNERKDGFDTIDWIAKQPWCSGRIGMIGASYGGYVQWCAAVEQHPALKCIIPQVSPPDLFYNIPYDHGTFFLFGSLWWANIVRDRDAHMERAAQLPPHPDKLTTLPLSKIDKEVLGVDIPFFKKWLEMDTPQAFARGSFEADLKNVTIPALHISGWWDGDGIGTKRIWQAMAKTPNKHQYLIYGPWTHAFNTTTRFGDADYGKTAILELDSVYLRWFDTWLKNRDVGWLKTPKVQAFVMGENRWHSLRAWPHTTAKTQTLYLAAQGSATGPQSKGMLLSAPQKGRSATTYTYNPAKVKIPKEFKDITPGVPAKDANIQKLDPGSAAYALFRSSPLKKPLTITGPIEADLRFSTNVVDTDLFAVLMEQDAKGTLRLIALPGKIAARWAQGFDKPRLLTPGKDYRAKIDIWDTAHRFTPGTRIVLLITSEMFPQYARNLNTGEPIKDAVRMVPANIKILHGTAAPSALRFKTLP